MDDRLKAALEEGARNGAADIFLQHDNYLAEIARAEGEYKIALQELGYKYAENEAKYEIAKSVLDGIIDKLDKKE